MSARWHPSQMAAGQNATPAAQLPAASNEGAAGNGVVPAQASSRWHPSGMAPAGEVPAAERLAGQGAGPSADARALVHQLPTPDERRVIALAEGESPDVDITCAVGGGSLIHFAFGCPYHMPVLHLPPRVRQALETPHQLGGPDPDNF